MYQIELDKRCVESTIIMIISLISISLDLTNTAVYLVSKIGNAILHWEPSSSVSLHFCILLNTLLFVWKISFEILLLVKLEQAKNDLKPYEMLY